MFFRPFKGIIALDIDGTITEQVQELDVKVIDALDNLAKDGWLFIFITGRPFQWSVLTLKPLPFSYALAVQNGALLIEIPSYHILIRKYLTQDFLPKLEEVAQEYDTDFVIYSGLENDDWCYYRPAFLPSSVLSYGLERASYLGEKWQPLQTFSNLPISHFSSVKFFAKDERALMLSQKIEKKLGLHAPPNRDPFNPDYFVIQTTHIQANKGNILKEFIQLVEGVSKPVIAAGNDHNDYTMLKVAHIKIVMSDAPSDLLDIADIVAPPASEQGIIKGLHEAIYRLSFHKP